MKKLINKGKLHLEQLTLKNNNYRKVIQTGKYSQLVIMSILPGQEIGLETHDTTDQFFRIEHGTAKVVLGKKNYILKAGDSIIIPAGTKHNLINTSKKAKLKLYTVYSPAVHKPGTIQKTKPKHDD
jgi:mannose-6-phosphate isomerase-like protein (cupin superfamily)